MVDTFRIGPAGERYIAKDPDATLDYGWDWGAWLAAAGGDTIASYSVALDEGLSLVSHAESAGVVTAFIAGGSAGQQLSASCRITTAAGRIDERSFVLRIEER